MPLSFEDSSRATVRAPDGRWFDVRIVPDDGRRPWPRALFEANLVIVFGPLYALYRALLRGWYTVRRSTRRRIEVHEWPDGVSAPPDGARPARFERTPDLATARRRAHEMREAIAGGELV